MSLDIKPIGDPSDIEYYIQNQVNAHLANPAAHGVGQGTSFYLDPANGSDSNNGKSVAKAFKTLPVAYAALTANQNDTLYYLAGASSISLAAAFDWHKDYCHFVGVAAPTMVGSRARIFQTASATSLSPLVTVSATGCVWSNIYVFQGVANAASLVAVSVTGKRNYFYRCQFVGGGAAEDAIDNNASLQLDAAAENFFEDCVFGSDTIPQGTGANVLRLVAQSARNYFRKCTFQTYISSATAAIVELTLATSMDRWMIFDDCLFVSESLDRGTAMASSFVIPANHITATVLLKNCIGLGFAAWDVNNRNLIYGNMNAVTAADLSGVAVLMNV
jgi:hypothetical protein